MDVINGMIFAERKFFREKKNISGSQSQNGGNRNRSRTAGKTKQNQCFGTWKLSAMRVFRETR